VKDGRIAEVSYREPFDDLFRGGEFEYETLVRSSRKGLTWDFVGLSGGGARVNK